MFFKRLIRESRSTSTWVFDSKRLIRFVIAYIHTDHRNSPFLGHLINGFNHLEVSYGIGYACEAIFLAYW
jgi:hypothetical protein